MPARFSYRVPDPQAFLSALELYLRARQRDDTAGLLEGASCAVSPSTAFSSDRWQALSTTVTFYVPGDRLAKFTGSVRQQLWLAAAAVLPKDTGLDVEQIIISPLLEPPTEDNRIGLNEGMLAGKGPLEHDGLRFRSRAETRIYDALKHRPVLFFPNPAAVLGGGREDKREPDFLVLLPGQVGTARGNGRAVPSGGHGNPGPRTSTILQGFWLANGRILRCRAVSSGAGGCRG